MEAIEDAELYEFSTRHFDTDSYRLVRSDRRRAAACGLRAGVGYGVGKAKVALITGVTG